MGFNIILTDGGRKTRDHIFDYYMNVLEDARLAERVYNDYLRTLQDVARMALSYQICEDKFLKTKGLRKLHFRKYNYKIFYEVRGNTAYIKAVLQDKQLPEKWLS